MTDIWFKYFTVIEGTSEILSSIIGYNKDRITLVKLK